VDDLNKIVQIEQEIDDIECESETNSI
jgi:hypothetical protein